MTGFYVDPAGLGQIAQLYSRAADDAEATLRYTEKHCDLSWDEVGLLMKLGGPHELAYGQITKALGQLAEFSSGAGGQIEASRAQYAQSDLDGLTALDQTYPGAVDPGSVRGSTAPNRYSSESPRAVFADAAEPQDSLVAPQYASGIEQFKINPMADLISPTAWLRQVSTWLFGHDPFEAWGQDFSGDWGSYEHCAAAWGKIGSAAFAIGRNLAAGAGDTGTVWRGNAAEAAQEYQLTLSAASMSLKDVCSQYHELYMQAAQAAKDTYSFVTGLAGKLIDYLIALNIAGVVGTVTIETGIGAVAGWGAAAYFAYCAWGVFKEIQNYMGNLDTVLKMIAGQVAAIEAGLKVEALADLKPYQHPALG